MPDTNHYEHPVHCQSALDALIGVVEHITSCPNCAACRELASQTVDILVETYPELDSLKKLSTKPTT